MKKPDNYDNVETKSFGEFKKLPAGGYVLKILNAECKVSTTGKEMIVLTMDIARGEFAGHYAELTERFQSDSYLKIYQIVDGDSLPYFKGMIKAIERSNPGFVFNFDERTLIGKLIGANLREEEYVNKEGKVATILKVAYCCSVQDVESGNVKPLEVKKIQGTTQSNETPAHVKDKDDLPF